MYREEKGLVKGERLILRGSCTPGPSDFAFYDGYFFIIEENEEGKKTYYKAGFSENPGKTRGNFSEHIS